MATIVNTAPAQTDSGSNGMGFLVGVMLLVLLVIAVLFYGLPYLRSSVGSATPQINVPGKIDVNVNQPGK
jgi:flagellar biogenesis protein FliO